MSIVELKEAAGKLSEKERAELSAYLIMIGRRNDPNWSAEMERRCDDFDAGKFVSQADFEQGVSDAGKKNGA